MNEQLRAIYIKIPIISPLEATAANIKNLAFEPFMMIPYLFSMLYS